LGNPESGYLIYSTGGGKIRLDLPAIAAQASGKDDSAAKGHSSSAPQFAGYWINPRSGRFTPVKETVDSSKPLDLDTPGGGSSVLWLTKK
jgi:hypothetical protein